MRQVVGFYRDKGKTKPITKSVDMLNRKKIVKKPKRFQSVTPSTVSKQEKKLLVAFKHKMLHMTAQSTNDGRERGCFFYVENDRLKSTPVRVGSDFHVGLKKDSEWLRSRRTDFDVVIGFHTHSGAEITPTSAPSGGDIRHAIQNRLNLECIGSVESPENPFPFIDCWRIDEETGYSTLEKTVC